MPSTTQRNAEQTKETILEAAATLFAERGFNATTLQQVATAAQVARGTPHYFFQSKELLYQSVLEREAQLGYQVVSNAKELIDLNLSNVELLTSFVDLYWQFLTTNPRFLKLLQWTALEQPYAMDKVQEHWNTLLGASDLVGYVVPAGTSEESIKHLTLSIIGMCTFSFFFGQMAARPLGIDARDDTFLDTRREHLKAQLAALLQNLESHPF